MKEIQDGRGEDFIIGVFMYATVLLITTKNIQ